MGDLRIQYSQAFTLVCEVALCFSRIFAQSWSLHLHICYKHNYLVLLHHLVGNLIKMQHRTTLVIIFFWSSCQDQMVEMIRLKQTCDKRKRKQFEKVGVYNYKRCPWWKKLGGRVTCMKPRWRHGMGTRNNWNNLINKNWYFIFSLFKVLHGGIVAGHGVLMSMKLHAFGGYTRAWAYGCKPGAWVYGIGFVRDFGTSIHVHGCNRPGWHGSKLVIMMCKLPVQSFLLTSMTRC